MSMTTELPTTISAQLRSCTAQAHESAERSRFLERLLGGHLDIDAWAALLEQYAHIYRALESAAHLIRERGELTDVVIPELDRSASIAADLEALAPRVSRPLPGLLPSTAEYVATIEASAVDAPQYLAHHYTRYLGDLSGGQAMRVMLDRAYGLSDAEATFFAFTEIPAVVPFKRDYRAHLDALPFSDAEIDRLLAAANDSFACNERIFAELDELSPATAE